MKKTDFPTKNCRSAKKIAQLRQLLKSNDSATFVVEMYMHLPDHKVLCETIPFCLHQFYVKIRHRRSAPEPLRGSGGMLPRKILKNRVSLMPFPAFWCGFLCMEQVTNEKKILKILVKQNMNPFMNEYCPTLK